MRDFLQAVREKVEGCGVAGKQVTVLAEPFPNERDFVRIELGLAEQGLVAHRQLVFERRGEGAPFPVEQVDDDPAAFDGLLEKSGQVADYLVDVHQRSQLLAPFE